MIFINNFKNKCKDFPKKNSTGELQVCLQRQNLYGYNTIHAVHIDVIMTIAFFNNLRLEPGC